MIHVVTSANRRAYAVQLGLLAETLADEARAGSALAAIKQRALPALDAPDQAYLLHLDTAGRLEFGVSLQPSSAAGSCHRAQPRLVDCSPPRKTLWECMFLTDRSRRIEIDRPKLAGFWAAVLDTAHRLGAAELAGLELGERGSSGEGGHILWEIPCDSGVVMKARALADGTLSTVRLTSRSAALVSGTEVEQLCGALEELGPAGPRIVHEILERTRALAETQGSARVVDRLEETRRSIEAELKAA